MAQTLKNAEAPLLANLQIRFNQNPHRHPKLSWETVQQKLINRPDKLSVLNAMEVSGGEPDVVLFPNAPTEIYFVDCVSESPLGRRSLCYDQVALDARKKNKPTSSAIETAEKMGIRLLTPEEYQHLQTLGDFDTKTSSWVVTPENIRSLGGALFGDKRYQQTFIYHNGADSYYAARGFRGLLEL